LTTVQPTLLIPNVRAAVPLAVLTIAAVLACGFVLGGCGDACPDLMRAT
jgi:hypothetical protein